MEKKRGSLDTTEDMCVDTKVRDELAMAQI
jgi:hypothetical protein